MKANGEIGSRTRIAPRSAAPAVWRSGTCEGILLGADFGALASDRESAQLDGRAEIESWNVDKGREKACAESAAS